MQCTRCLNTDERYFYNDNGTFYCRRCIMFGRVDVGQHLPITKYQTKQHHCHYHLDYTLTKYQMKVIKKLNEHLAQKRNVLVYAATGAGKTEIVMQSIQDYLNAGKKVGMAIARRQVVLEICDRMKKAFSTLKVIPVCEGYTKIVDSDFIICTMHQLYRYHQAFDLLIMDEVDAFPYKNNEVLEAIAHHACKGETVYLTATPDEKMLKAVKENKLHIVELFQRPHGYDLIVPNVKRAPFIVQFVLLFIFLQRHKNMKKKVLVFTPTIQMSISLAHTLSYFFKCASLSSQTKNKDQIIKDLKQGTYDFLVATTVLERGITISGVDIVIVKSEHMVFDEASLIQIAGRAGRSMKEPTGEVLFLCQEKSKEMQKCIGTILKMNKKI